MNKLFFLCLITLSTLPARARHLAEPAGGHSYYPAYSYDPNYKGFHMGFYSGAWIPTGQLSLLGVHPYVGVQLGFANSKFMLDFSVAARFLKSAHSYTIAEDDSLRVSYNYSAGYCGLDGSYNLYKKGSHEWDLEAGAGFEAILVYSVKRPGDKKKIGHDLYSPNINMGLGYKHWFKAGYIGFDLKYNILFFNNKNATDFTGNAVTLGLCVGGIARL